jgi:hypothetical protein
VTFADDEVAFCKTLDVVTDSINDTGKFMTDGHRHGNRFLRPRVPVIDVQVRATDRCFQHANQHIVTADSRNRNLFEP